MPKRVDDDLGFRDLVEDQVRIGRCRQATDGRVAGAAAGIGMQWQQIDNGLDAGVNTPRAVWRLRSDVIEDAPKVGKRRASVAELQRPCLRHAARTSSSVANSP